MARELGSVKRPPESRGTLPNHGLKSRPSPTQSHAVDAAQSRRRQKLQVLDADGSKRIAQWAHSGREVNGKQLVS